MKKLLMLSFTFVLAFSLATAAHGEFDANADYMQAMVTAAAAGDAVAGEQAEVCRNQKIDALNLSYSKVRYADLFLLAKIIYAEAGSAWLSQEWKFCVGEVVMNRVASPEFPDTLEDVIYQPGQYYGRSSRYFAALIPDETHASIAARLLQGERHMKPSVVFQANFLQGGGAYLHLCDSVLGSTYLCVSSHPGLYT